MSFSSGAAGALAAGLVWSKDPGEASFASVTMTLKDAAGVTLTSASSATGSLSLTYLLAAATTYKVSLANNSSGQAVRSFTRTLTRPSQGHVQLVIKDVNGATVATGQGLKPVTVNVGLAPGSYTAVSTPMSGAGNATLSGTFAGRPPSITTTFNANDHATAVNDGTTTVTETLSPSGRVLRRRVGPSGGAATEDTLLFYDDDGDSPAYTQPFAGGPVTTYLGGAIDVGGVITYQHANAHGDVIGTSNAAGTFTERPAADEYGLDTAQPSDRLGWLGIQQRFNVGLANLTRMGVRLYDPTTGRFTSVDPVEGGSANDYDYVAGDPVNDFDLAGTFSFKKFGRRLGKIARRAAPIVGTIGFAVCVAGTGGLCGGLGVAAVLIGGAGRASACIDGCKGGFARVAALSALDAGLQWAGGGAVRGAVKGSIIRGGFKGSRSFARAMMSCGGCRERVARLGLARLMRQTSSWAAGGAMPK